MLTRLDLTMDQTMQQGDADALTEVERKTWDPSAAIYAESAVGLTRHALPVLIEGCRLMCGSHAIDVGCGPGLVANMIGRTGEAGFGLAIARWVVEANGGRIELETEQDKGSTFRIVLPNRGDSK